MVEHMHSRNEALDSAPSTSMFDKTKTTFKVSTISPISGVRSRPPHANSFKTLKETSPLLYVHTIREMIVIQKRQGRIQLKKMKVLTETFLVVQGLRLPLLVQRVQVRPLVGRILHALGPKHQNIKQKQCCNKINKDFTQMVHIRKSLQKK